MSCNSVVSSSRKLKQRSISFENIGRRISSPHSTNTEYTLHGGKCEEVIEEAYQYASKMLLEILLNDYDLIGRLR
jgi:hypothetical protein